MDKSNSEPIFLRYKFLTESPAISLRRKKRFHSKTRNGNQTCRQRRIKCDDQKPSCLRCRKIDQKCRYGGGQANPQTIRYQPAPLVPDNLDISHLEFFLTNTVDMMTPSPTSSLAMASPLSPQDFHARYSQLWSSLILAMAFTESQILELRSGLARLRRLALTTSYSGVQEHTFVVRTMSRIIETRSVDVVVVGAVILFVYESLHSAAAMSDSESQGHVHSVAFMKLLPAASKTVLKSVLPMVGLTRTLHEFCKDATARNGEPLHVPDWFEDVEEVQAYFTDVLWAPNLRPALQEWLRAVFGLYERVRESDWKGSNALLKLLGRVTYC